MIVPLHLHGLWIGLLLVSLLLLCLLITITLAFWSLRWDFETLAPWPQHKLVVTAIFGIVLSILYWIWVLTGTVAILPRDPIQLGLHAVGSSAGVTGSYVLWKLDSDIVSETR